MQPGVTALMLLCAAAGCSMAQDIAGETVPRDVPPVKLFEELDYELPGLSAVEAAIDQGDEAAAKAALLAHFRSRDDVRLPEPDNQYDTRLADEMLLGRFVWGDTVCYYGPEVEDIEWYKVPEGVYWPQFDHELGRHTFVTTLVNAYRRTGQEKYASHLIALILEFIKDCPVEDGRGMARINNMDGLAVKRIGREALATEGHPAMMWSLMVAMRRVQRWPSILQYCIHAEAMTPDALATILTSLIEHERYIIDAVEVCKGGNHGTRTAATALEMAARFPEFKERDDWADRAMADLLNRYNWRDTNPLGFIYRDGATVEISPEVGRGDYGTLLAAMKWLRMLRREMPEQLVEIQEKNLEYFAYISWPSELAWRAAHGRKGPGLPGRGDLDFIESGGREGTVPEHTSYPMRSVEPCYAGTYFMRSDWTPEAVALRVRFGPIQYKYSQSGLADVGDIGVWGYGVHLVPHIYKHPRTGPFREYGDRSFAGDGRSENTISVDGVGQGKYGRVRYIDEPLDNPWITTPVFDYVRGCYRFDPEQVKATHTRAILFVKPDYFVVIDRIKGDEGPHQYRMKYQLHQDLSARVEGTRAVGQKEGEPLIVIAPSRDDLELSVIKGQEEPYREGWHLYSEKQADPAPALIYEWEQTPPARVETIIWPVKPGEPADLDVNREVADGVITLTVKRGASADVIVFGEAGDIILHRMADDVLVGAGAVALRAEGPVAAYLKRQEDGRWVASSNSETGISLVGGRPDEPVEQIEWDGR